MRIDFEMTEEQLSTLLEASKPVPYLIIGGREPSSPQENANRAWKALGKEMGFHYMTVKPTGQDVRFFSAEPIGEEK